MVRRRADAAPLALTSNGVVVLNVLAALDPAQAKKLRLALPRGYGAEWFIGVAARGRALNAVLARLEDASAEAAARCLAPAQNKKGRARGPAQPKRRAPR